MLLKQLHIREKNYKGSWRPLEHTGKVSQQKHRQMGSENVKLADTIKEKREKEQ